MERPKNDKISREDAILDYIKKKDYVTVKELSHRFSISDTRNVRKVIESLRERGKPICISTKGYFYSESKEDIEDTMNTLLRQAKGQIDTAKRLEKIIKKLDLEDEPIGA